MASAISIAPSVNDSTFDSTRFVLFAAAVGSDPGVMYKHLVEHNQVGQTDRLPTSKWMH